MAFVYRFPHQNHVQLSSSPWMPHAPSSSSIRSPDNIWGAGQLVGCHLVLHWSRRITVWKYTN